MQAIILAAGRGKRLHPITETRTKAMAPIMGKPIVERVMEPLIAYGIRDFVLVISPDDESVHEYFQNAAFENIRIQLIEQPKPLGMAHALLQAAPFIHQNFALSSCDNLMPWKDIQDILALWNSEKRPQAILSLLRVPPESVYQYGIVKLEGQRVIDIVEKPDPKETPSNIASPPFYCFQQDFLDYLPKVEPSPRGEYELQNAIQMLIQDRGDVHGFHISRRIDLTTPADLLKINLLYCRRNQGHYFKASSQIGSGTRLIPPYHIEAGVKLGANCTLGPNVFIERDCVIADRVQLQNVVVLREREVSTGNYQNLIVY